MIALSPPVDTLNVDQFNGGCHGVSGGFCIGFILGILSLGAGLVRGVGPIRNLRISAPVEQLDAQVARAIEILETTPGVASARALSGEEQSDLLTPWLGVDVPFDQLPLPRLIEIVQTPMGLIRKGCVCV